MLDLVPKVDHTTVVTTACSAGSAPERTTTNGAAGFFIRRDAARVAALDRSCVDVAAFAYGPGGTLLGAASTRILRGDYSVSGKVTRPTKTGDEPVRDAQIAIRVGDLAVETTTDATGKSSIAGLTEGTIWSITAFRRTETDLLSAKKEPRTALGAATPNATFTLSLEPAAPVGDVFEPDDYVSELATRTALTLGVGEAHVSSGAADVDLVPFDALAGAAYTLNVRSTSAVVGDFALAFLDASGTVKAEGNVKTYSATPKLTWSAPSSGRYFVRISRNDKEQSAVPYALVLIRE